MRELRHGIIQQLCPGNNAINIRQIYTGHTPEVPYENPLKFRGYETTGHGIHIPYELEGCHLVHKFSIVYCRVPARRGLQRTTRAATRHGARDPLVRPQVDP